MKTFKQFMVEAKETAKSHIARYTDLSRPLSRELYRLHDEGLPVPDTIEGHNIPALDDITKKTSLSKKLVVHTGIRHNPMTLVDKDNNIHIPAYLSTSESKDVADRFATRQARRSDRGDTLADAHVLSIGMERGQYGANISGKSVEKDEAERLLPRNTVLKIHPVPKIRTDKTGRKIHTWDAKIVSQN